MKKNKYLQFCSIILLVIATAIKTFPQQSEKITIKKSEINIRNEDEFRIKLYLVEKYKPGDFSGMPQIRNPAFEMKVSEDLVLKIKKKLKLTDDSAAEEIARKMSRIGLTKKTKTKYYFEIRDGSSGGVTTYKGLIILRKNKIIEKILEKTETMEPS
jgi:hypothetical protein